MELFTPDFGLIFWMFVAFLVLFFILWKFAWPTIMKTVNSRAEMIDKGVEYARDAKQQLDSAKEQAEQYKSEARKEQADMLRDADRMRTQIIEEARSAAQVEAQKVMDNAKLQIEQQQKQAQQQFKNQVSDFALDIASKIVMQQLDEDKKQSELVNNLLSKIDSEK